MATPEQIVDGLPIVVPAEWALPVVGVRVLGGGMNSVAVMVQTPTGPVVAKWVAAQGRDDLLRGIAAAAILSRHGLRTGPAVPTASGAMTVPFLGGELVLLEEVAGEPLTGSPPDLWDWGATLARVHALTATSGRGPFLPWLDEHGTDLRRERWVRQVVANVLRDYNTLPDLTWAQLHTDPEPEAFRRDERGDIGVIDWTGSVRGPVLYDLASALMYAGESGAHVQLIAGYLSGGGC